MHLIIVGVKQVPSFHSGSFTNYDGMHILYTKESIHCVCACARAHIRIFALSLSLSRIASYWCSHFTIRELIGLNRKTHEIILASLHPPLAAHGVRSDTIGNQAAFLLHTYRNLFNVDSRWLAINHFPKGIRCHRSHTAIFQMPRIRFHHSNSLRVALRREISIR